MLVVDQEMDLSGIVCVCVCYLFILWHESPPVGQSPLNIDASWSQTQHSVELLWTNNQSYAETSTWQHTTLTRDRCSPPPPRPPGISNPPPPQKEKCPPPPRAPVEFEPAIPASERPQTYALNPRGNQIRPSRLSNVVPILDVWAEIYKRDNE